MLIKLQALTAPDESIFFTGVTLKPSKAIFLNEKRK
jgi:hypothetical protein